MKKRLFVSMISAICVMSLLSGCGRSSDSYKGSYETSSEAAYDYYSDYDMYEEAPAEMYDVGAGYGNDATVQADTVDEGAASSSEKSKRKLIRNVSLNVETYDYAGLTQSIENQVSSLGGYIESCSMSGEEKKSSRTASYVLRVPAAKADEVIASVAGSSNVTSRSESVEDVTLTYVDIQSRKESLQVEYDRLEELLKDAETIEELIYIEQRLSEVRYEIQSIESQLRTYDDKVDYTTINLSVREVREYTEPPKPEPVTFGQRLTESFVNAIVNVFEGIQNFVIFLVAVIPYLIVLGIPVVIIVLIVRACLKKSDKKRADKYAEYVANKNNNVPQSENTISTSDANVPYSERHNEEE